MKKAMFLLLLPFLAAAMFLLSSAPAESRTVQDIQSYVDAAKALNLSEGNLQVKSNEFDAEEILKDARFMGLLRGRIRIARLVDRAMRDSEGGNGDLNTEVGPIVAFLLSGQNGQQIPHGLHRLQATGLGPVARGGAPGSGGDHGDLGGIEPAGAGVVGQAVAHGHAFAPPQLDDQSDAEQGEEDHDDEVQGRGGGQDAVPEGVQGDGPGQSDGRHPSPTSGASRI